MIRPPLSDQFFSPGQMKTATQRLCRRTDQYSEPSLWTDVNRGVGLCAHQVERGVGVRGEAEHGPKPKALQDVDHPPLHARHHVVVDFELIQLVVGLSKRLLLFRLVGSD